MIRFLGFPPIRCLVLALCVQGCVSVESSSLPTAAATSSIVLSDADAAVIGRKIWQNECGGTVEGLTSWNAGEDFPSLGIGISSGTFPAVPVPLRRDFPAPRRLYERAQGGHAGLARRGEWMPLDEPPAICERAAVAPHEGTPSVPRETPSRADRLHRTAPRTVPAANGTSHPGPAGRGQLRANFQLMASSRSGLYALIDYVNFKARASSRRNAIRDRAGVCATCCSR